MNYFEGDKVLLKQKKIFRNKEKKFWDGSIVTIDKMEYYAFNSFYMTIKEDGGKHEWSKRDIKKKVFSKNHNIKTKINELKKELNYVKLKIEHIEKSLDSFINYEDKNGKIVYNKFYSVTNENELRREITKLSNSLVDLQGYINGY